MYFMILLMIFLCMGIGMVILHFMALAVALSKVTVSLVIARFISSAVVIVASSSLLNYLIWAGIVLAACFLICLLPGINCAWQFFCTSVVTYLLAFLLFSMVISFVDVQVKTEIAGEIVIKVMSILFGAMAAIKEMIDIDDMRKISNVVLENLERLVASLISGLGMTVVICSTNHYHFETAAQVTILLITAAVIFLGDIILLSRIHTKMVSSSHVRNKPVCKVQTVPQPVVTTAVTNTSPAPAVNTGADISDVEVLDADDMEIDEFDFNIPTDIYEDDDFYEEPERETYGFSDLVDDLMEWEEQRWEDEFYDRCRDDYEREVEQQWQDDWDYYRSREYDY